jgi:hypothetical protein
MLFIVAVLVNGWSRPITALTLLTITNLSYCVSLGLYLLILLLRGDAAISLREDGGVLHIYPIETIMRAWAVFIPLCVVYELVIFIRAIAINQKRWIAGVGAILALSLPVAEVFLAKWAAIYILNFVLNGV